MDKGRQDLDIQRGLAYDLMGYASSKGVPLLNLFDIGAAVDRARRKINAPLKDAFSNIQIAVRQGATFSEAMKTSGFQFYDYESKKISEGEDTGDIVLALQGLAKILNAEL